MKTVAIAGAGIIGLTTAWRLARQGWQVTVFDRREVLHEASWAAAGMLAPGGEIDAASDPALVRMALASLDLYPEFVRDLEEDSGFSLEYRRCGAIDLAATEEKAALQAALGIHSSPCDFRGRRARWYPNDAVVDPLSINDALRAVCRRYEVQIHEHEPVSELLPNAVRTAHGEFAADRIVVACGAWSSELLPGLPRSYPVRGHLISFDLSPGLLPAIVRDAHTYLIQRENGSVIAGSSMEMAGFDRAVHPEIVEAIRRRAADLVPELAGLEPTNCWTGLRPASDTGPVIRRIPGTNTWAAYGHFRNGILLAPYTCRLIAEEIGQA
ncbi:MAG TPA: FAD-dependent oxidoreductase [Bryobacteraceae bacterium]|nr:FAD-dependent oxidoreductase [Bryobacteraceae bacterium]